MATFIVQGINYCGLDCMFIPHVCGSVVSWLVSIISCVQLLSDGCSHFSHATIWVSSTYFTFHQSVISDNLVEGWNHHVSSVNSVMFGDCIYTLRTYITLFKSVSSQDITNNTIVPLSTPHPRGYSEHILSDYNSVLDNHTLPLNADLMKDTQLDNVSICLTSPLVITELEASWDPFIMSIVLHLSHLATEPNLGSFTSEFGKRFGIPFCDSNDEWYARPIFLWSCYVVIEYTLISSIILLFGWVWMPF